jgi:hypothetical protein
MQFLFLDFFLRNIIVFESTITSVNWFDCWEILYVIVIYVHKFASWVIYLIISTSKNTVTNAKSILSFTSTLYDLINSFLRLFSFYLIKSWLKVKLLIINFVGKILVIQLRDLALVQFILRCLKNRFLCLFHSYAWIFMPHFKKL